MTANEILDLLEEEDEEEDDVADAVDVALFPPAEAADAQSDADSDASDEPVGLVHHLPRRMLAAGAEMTMAGDGEADGDVEEGPKGDGDDAAPPSKRKKRARQQRRWRQGHARTKSVPDFAATYAPNAESLVREQCTSAYDFYRLFIDEEFVSLVAKQTTLYARQHNATDWETDEDQLMAFFGILLLSGYARLPRRRFYWQSDPDVFNDLISKSMRRDVFENISKYLHLADNSLLGRSADKPDPYFKVRPLFDHLNNKFKLLEKPKKLSIDESMVPYYGHHPCKQYIRCKPVRFGFKLWCITTADGYLLHAEPYCGRATMLKETGLGQGADVVLGLVEASEVGPGHELFFDNLFTSVDLLDVLDARGIGATGTLRENRRSGAPLPSRRDMDKTSRGTVAEAHCGHITLVTWKDNKSVTLASNLHSAQPISSKTCWSRKDKREVSVPLPKIVREYNQAMGGVDLFDEAVAAYRVHLRSKKWWRPLLNWGINASAVNAWRLRQKITGKKDGLLEFLRELAMQMLALHGSTRKRPGRPLSLPGPAGDVARKDGLRHWPRKGTTNRARCRQCGGRSAYECTKCNLPVHPECMEAFHS